MSPARRSVNPQQEALDLGLPEPAPAKTKPAKAEAAQGEPAESTAVEPTRAQRGKKATLLLSDEQLRTTAELTVRDLAAYARGEVSRAELSERAAQRASAPYRKALKTLKHSLGPAAHTMTDDALYELVDIALAARQATQAEEPARKKATRKAPAQKKTVQKAPAQKELVQNEPSPQESETAARDIPARPQKVTKASEEVEQEPAPKKSAPEIEAEKSATKKSAPKKAVAKKTVPAEKAPASKASTSRTPASKTPTKPKTATPKTASKKATPAQKTPAPKKASAQKASAKKTATKQATTKTVAAEKPASAVAEAKSRALARYASEDRIENAPLKKYLPAPSAKAIATHLGITTVGQMLEYFPRKYLPRGELSSFAELVEGQDVTIIARVVHVSTRTMAARRGKITEVTITDRLSDATGQDAPAGFGAAGFGAAGYGAGGPVSVAPGRANRPGASGASNVSGASGVSGAPAQNWQATGMHNPRINALANYTQNPAVQGGGAQPVSYSGYADSYGQDSFAQDSFAQGGLFGVPAPSMTNPGTLIGSQMKLSFFNAWTAAREIREGETMMFSGRVGIYRGEYTLTNPHYALLSKDASGADVTDAATAPVPVYRAPVKLPTDRISGYMAQLLEKVPLKELEDPVPYTIRRARKVPSLEWTYRALHTPDSEDTWRAAQAQMRYREAFVLQSALARLHSVRAAHLTQPRPAVEGGLADRLLQILPYELTEGQQKVGAEIAADLSSESPMNRLLQGDVGSGKTVVALRAMLQVADAGGQSAMLAPTEVLAEQHLRSVLDILGDMAAPEDSDADDSAEGTPAGSGEEPSRVRVRLLTASMGTRAKRKVLQELADGTAQIVIGTHALLSDEVSFHDLGLVVVDEQHRFGVEQRDSLRGTDGALPHRLVMTATPIPRTVAMTVFGDLDVSVLDTLPAGRQKISTHVVPLAEKPAWASRLWRRAREEIDAGHQVYVVVPKIGEDGDSLEEGAAFFGASSLNGAGAGNSAQGYFGQGGSASSDGKVQLTSVASMYSYLSAEDALVGVRIGTLHGRMDPAEKTAVMTAFERGEIDLLISTTVIEVGVNVPNATLMIIMDADRFGISGLHQLRGRVGRGGYAGTCLLVTRQEEGGVSRERLDAVASTTDGFELSRIDLAQRREGDILGAAQSGSKSTLRFLRALADADIIERAREDARSVVEKDPTLAKHPSLARTIDRALDADREAFLGRG